MDLPKSRLEHTNSPEKRYFYSSFLLSSRGLEGLISTGRSEDHGQDTTRSKLTFVPVTIQHLELFPGEGRGEAGLRLSGSENGGGWGRGYLGVRRGEAGDEAIWE